MLILKYREEMEHVAAMNSQSPGDGGESLPLTWPWAAAFANGGVPLHELAPQSVLLSRKVSQGYAVYSLVACHLILKIPRPGS